MNSFYHRDNSNIYRWYLNGVKALYYAKVFCKDDKDDRL